MNEEAPPELAVVIKKNAEMTGRMRLQKICDTIVSDVTGLPVQSDLDFKQSALITRQLIPLRALARSVVRTIDPDDDLICLRVASDNKEYFMMWDEDFMIASIQKIETTGKDVRTRPGFSTDSPRLCSSS